jgi:hypothetical protein
MTEQTLWTEIVRLQKMRLDTSLQESVEEAAQLLADGHHLEAEALVENAEARARLSRESAEPVTA